MATGCCSGLVGHARALVHQRPGAAHPRHGADARPLQRQGPSVSLVASLAGVKSQTGLASDFKISASRSL
jgi:hypothetical protein